MGKWHDVIVSLLVLCRQSLGQISGFPKLIGQIPISRTQPLAHSFATLLILVTAQLLQVMYHSPPLLAEFDAKNHEALYALLQYLRREQYFIGFVVTPAEPPSFTFLSTKSNNPAGHRGRFRP
ncbi:hypothetical protein ACLGGT_07105 [Roseovarius sp. MS2]